MYVALVYQAGIANVFNLETYQRPESPDGRMAVRVNQSSYGDCESFVRGILTVRSLLPQPFLCGVFHCDKAGDIALQPWSEGPGELWADAKRPPVLDSAELFRTIGP